MGKRLNINLEQPISSSYWQFTPEFCHRMIRVFNSSSSGILNKDAYCFATDRIVSANKIAKPRHLFTPFLDSLGSRSL
jgi:hypothetical protein